MTTHKPPINLSFKIGGLHGTICTFILHTSHVLYVQVYMYILHIFIILKISIINSKHIYIYIYIIHVNHVCRLYEKVLDT